MTGEKERSQPVPRAVGARRVATRARREQRDLRETSDQFRLAQETLGVVTWIWDLKKDRVQWYGNMALHLGLAPGSFSGRFQDYLRHVHPNDMARAKSTFVSCLKGKTPEYRSEERVLWSDGSEHWLETYGRASYGPDGNALRLTGVIKNITHRKRQEAARARAEKLVNQVFDASPNYVLIVRLRDARVMAANRAFERVTGYNAQQAIGRTIDEIGLWANPDDRAPFIAELRQNGTVHSLPLLIRSRRGRHISGVISASLIEQDGEQHILGIVHDTSEVKALENRTRQSEQKYAALFDSNPEAIIITRVHDAVILGVNAAWEHYSGFRRDEVLGRTAFELRSWVNPDDRTTVVTRLDTEGRVSNFETRFRRADGDEIEVLVSAARIEVEGEVCAIWSWRDVTEQRRGEREHREANTRYRTLFESSVDGMSICRPDGAILDVNPAHCRRLGYTREEMIGRPFQLFLDPEELAAKPVRSDLSENWASVERVLPCKGGGGVPTEIVSGPMPDGNVLAILRDITERKLAEENLRRFRLAMDSSGDAIVLVDRTSMRYIDVNQTLCELVGYTRQEVLRMTPMELFCTSREILERDYDSLIADKDSSSGKIEGQYRHKDGSLIPIETSRRAMKADSGWIIVANARNIAERKRAEDELRSSRRMLEIVIDAIPMSIFAKDTKSKYVMVNKYAAEFFGTSKQALINLHTSQLPTHDSTRQQSLVDDQWVYRNRKTFAHETIIHRPDGTPVPFHSSKIPLFDKGGDLIGLLGINRDISAEKRAQEALRESEQRFRAVFERSRAGIAIWGLDGRFLSVNNAFCNFVGYSAHELIGKMSAGDLRHPGEDDGLDLTGRMLRGEIAHITRDRPYRRRDAGTVWGRTSVAGVTNKEGVLQYFVAVVIDISEAHEARKRIETLNVELDQRVQERTAELRDAVSELEEANRELDSFNFSISHDLRQPLNAIAGFSELLNEKLNGENSGDALEFVREIETNAGRMEQMIEALLSFARTGRGSVEKMEVNTQYLVDSVLRNLATAAPLRAEISVGELPAAQGDERLLRQVWTNLLGNALKYSGKVSAPKIEISGTLTNGMMEYAVRDNGVGFDMRDAEHIFGVFQRLPSSSGFEGSGVGLAIVQRIVHRHGGKVDAESAPGKGATFRFTLPA